MSNNWPDTWPCSVEGCTELTDPAHPYREKCVAHRLTDLAAERVAILREAIPPLYRSADRSLLAPALAERIDRALTTRYGLYIHGLAGTGKTYAVAAMLLDHGNKGIVEAVSWANVPELLENIRRTFNAPTKAQPYDDLANVRHTLVLDDLGAEKPTDWVRERLYTIINKRYEYSLPTIVTSNLSIDELAKQVGARVSSRLCELCDIVELQGVDRRKTRVVS